MRLLSGAAFLFLAIYVRAEAELSDKETKRQLVLQEDESGSSDSSERERRSVRSPNYLDAPKDPEEQKKLQMLHMRLLQEQDHARRERQRIGPSVRNSYTPILRPEHQYPPYSKGRIADNHKEAHQPHRQRQQQRESSERYHYQRGQYQAEPPKFPQAAIPVQATLDQSSNYREQIASPSFKRHQAEEERKRLERLREKDENGNTVSDREALERKQREHKRLWEEQEEQRSQKEQARREQEKNLQEQRRIQEQRDMAERERLQKEDEERNEWKRNDVRVHEPDTYRPRDTAGDRRRKEKEAERLIEVERAQRHEFNRRLEETRKGLERKLQEEREMILRNNVRKETNGIEIAAKVQVPEAPVLRKEKQRQSLAERRRAESNRALARRKLKEQKEEQERLKNQRKEKHEQSLAKKRRLDTEEALAKKLREQHEEERLEKERKAREHLRHVQEKKARERKQQEEQERLEKERKEKERLEHIRREKERLDHEEKRRLEEERASEARRMQEERLRLLREQMEREEREKADERRLEQLRIQQEQKRLEEVERIRLQKIEEERLREEEKRAGQRRQQEHLAKEQERKRLAYEEQIRKAREQEHQREKEKQRLELLREQEKHALSHQMLAQTHHRHHHHQHRPVLSSASSQRQIYQPLSNDITQSSPYHVILHTSELQDALDRGETWLVLIYAPWCAHSRRAIKEWPNVARAVQRPGHRNIKIAAFNVKNFEHTNVPAPLYSRYIPTARLFAPELPYGGAEFEGLVQAHPVAQWVDYEIQMIEYNKQMERMNRRG